MKKTPKNKLHVNRETLRFLEHVDHVSGGGRLGSVIFPPTVFNTCIGCPPDQRPVAGDEVK